MRSKVTACLGYTTLLREVHWSDNYFILFFVLKLLHIRVEAEVAGQVYGKIVEEALIWLISPTEEKPLQENEQPSKKKKKNDSTTCRCDLNQRLTSFCLILLFVFISDANSKTNKQSQLPQPQSWLLAFILFLLHFSSSHSYVSLTLIKPRAVWWSQS